MRVMLSLYLRMRDSNDGCHQLFMQQDRNDGCHQLLMQGGGYQGGYTSRGYQEGVPGGYISLPVPPWVYHILSRPYPAVIIPAGRLHAVKERGIGSER